MLKSTLIALGTAAALLAGTNAHAGVRWSVGVNLPLPVPVIGAVVSAPAYGGYYDQAPAYAAAPVYAPAPVVYGAPVYAPVPVYGGYYARPGYYRAAPVVYYRHPGWHRGWR